MDEMDYNKSRSNSHQKKSSSRRNYIVRWNSKKSDKRTRGPERTRKEQWTSIGRWWNSLCQRKNLCSK